MELKNTLTLKWIISLYLVYTFPFLVLGIISKCDGIGFYIPDWIAMAISFIFLLTGPPYFLLGFNIYSSSSVIAFLLSTIIVFILITICLNIGYKSYR